MIGFANRRVYKASNRRCLTDLYLMAGVFFLAFIMQPMITKNNDGPVNRGSGPQTQPSSLSGEKSEEERA
jgi:hypothetical protein